jgi:hypothetical protein
MVSGFGFQKAENQTLNLRDFFGGSPTEQQSNDNKTQGAAPYFQPLESCLVLSVVPSFSASSLLMNSNKARTMLHRKTFSLFFFPLNGFAFLALCLDR